MAGPIFSGNTVSLRGCNGYCIDVEHKSVAARWTVAGEWQSLQLELVDEQAARRESSAERLLGHGDIVHVRAHTGKLLRCPQRGSVGGDAVTQAPLEASTLLGEEAQQFELLLC